MVFMHDQLQDGRSLRLFNLIDDFNCEAMAIEIELSLPSVASDQGATTSDCMGR